MYPVTFGQTSLPLVPVLVLPRGGLGGVWTPLGRTSPEAGGFHGAYVPAKVVRATNMGVVSV